MFGAVVTLLMLGELSGAVPQTGKFWKDYENCGTTISNRIIGGKEARLGQFPWMALIGYNDSRRIVYNGGGAIITRRYILTAAHIYSPKIGQIPVVAALGEHDMWQDPDCQRGVCAPPVQRKTIEKIISHPGYVNDLDPNDIALLRVTEPIQFNDFVKPICLPFGAVGAQNLTNRYAEVAGWGDYNTKVSAMSSTLQTLLLRIWSPVRCKKHFQEEYNIQVTALQMCAGGVEGEDTCSGDSGGPLMMVMEEDGLARYYAVGIVSFGNEVCAQENRSAIYTDVTKFTDWIVRQVSQGSG